MRKELDRKIVLEDGSEYLGWGFGDTEVTRVCEIVFNTVPGPVFTAAVPLPEQTALYVELASVPGYTAQGIPAGVRVLQAGSLPGKYAPQAAGRAIAAVLLGQPCGERNGLS